MGPLEFFIHLNLLAALWPWNRFTLWQELVPGLSPGGKDGQCLGLAHLPPSCAGKHQLPWTPRDCPGLLWNCCVTSTSLSSSVICQTKGPKPLPKRFLHTVRSRASSFNWQYPLLSVRSSSSFLPLLPRLLVTSICPFIFHTYESLLLNSLIAI